MKNLYLPNNKIFFSNMNMIPSRKKLRIAFCPPEFYPLQLSMWDESTDATYLVQSHIAKRLLFRGHELTYIAQRDLGNNVCTKNLIDPALAPLTWSNSVPFGLFQKLIIKSAEGIPYQKQRETGGSCPFSFSPFSYARPFIICF